MTGIKITKFTNLQKSPQISTSFSNMFGTEQKSPANAGSWKLLSDEIMQLNRNNFVKCNKVIINKLTVIIQSGSPVFNHQTAATLYILYELSFRELLTKSFPMSASIIDTLSNSCNSILELIQPLIQDHLKQLQQKLRRSMKINGTDIGVIFLLVNMYKLDKMASRTSSAVTHVMEQLIADAADYVELLGKSDVGTDSLVLLFFGLLSYSIMSGYKNQQTNVINCFIRKQVVKNIQSFSKLCRVLALDILEQTQTNGKLIPLYKATYDKVLQSGQYVLDGVIEFLCATPYPGCEDCSIKIPDDQEEREKLFGNDSVLRSDSNSSDDSGCPGENLENVPVSEEAEERDLFPVFTSPTSPDEKVERKPSWTRRISEIQSSSVNTVTEVMLIPERNFRRVVGYGGAILRKLELQSKTSINLSKAEVASPVQKPKTKNLVAQRLIFGALGIPEKVSEQVDKESTYDTNVIRQTDQEHKQETRELTITGIPDDVLEAKKMINDIINCIVTVTIPLDFSVDEILSKYSAKLKTIEMLLNVYIEVEELDDFKVHLRISGDQKSCKDGQKLVFEEFGSFRSRNGQLFFIPSELRSCLKDPKGINDMLKVVEAISGAQIMLLKSLKDYAVFVSGYPLQISRAMQIFQKTNVEVLCFLSIKQGEVEVGANQICDYIKNRFQKNLKTATLAKNAEKPICPEEKEKRRITYDKNELIEMAYCSVARVFPESLQKTMEEDPITQCIIHPESLTKKVEEVLASLSTPMLSGYNIDTF